MPEEQISYQMEGQDFVREAQRIAKEWENMTGETVKHVNAVTKYLQVGKAVKNVLAEVRLETENSTRSTIQLYDAKGKSINTETRRATTLTRETAAMKEAAKATRKALIEEQKLNEAKARAVADARKAAAYIGKSIQSKTDPKQLNLQGLFNLKDAVGSLKSYVKQHQVSSAKVRALWEKVRIGDVTAISDPQMRNIQKQMFNILRLQNQYNTGWGKSLDLGNKYDRSISRASRATEAHRKQIAHLRLSWENIVHLVAVQLAHQAVSALVRGMSEGVRQAVAIQKAISEIQTISQKQQLSTDEWLGGLRQISDVWGLDIAQQAEATYQAISNQIAKGSEALTFLSSANKFAVATVSTTDDAVNLLTAALNSFEKSAYEAEITAATFFKTIELGRVRANEMAQSYGRISVIANKLNIEMYELNAAIATLTIQGIKYNEAATQIRGILLKLIKPTGEMKKFFSELGVSSGEAAIQVYGLGGFLKELQERTKGQTTEIAKLVNRLRGLTGTLAFSGEGFEIYKKNEEALKDPLLDYEKAVDLVMSNVGKKFEIELNKVKNYFKVDIGTDFLNKIVIFFDTFDGADTVIRSTAKAITQLLVPALSVLGAYLLKVAATNPLFLTLATAGVAFSELMDHINRFKIAAVDAQYTSSQLVAQNAKLLDSWNALFVNITNNITRGIADLGAETIQATAKHIGAVNTALFANAEAYEASVDAMKDSQKASIELFEEQIKDTTKRIQEIKSNIEDIRKEIKDSEFSAQKDIFGLQFNEAEIREQIDMVIERLTMLQKKSAIVAKEGDYDAFKIFDEEYRQLLIKQINLEAQLETQNETNAKKRAKLFRELRKARADYNDEISVLKLKESQLHRDPIKNAVELREIQHQINDATLDFHKEWNDIRDSIKDTDVFNLERVEIEETINKYYQTRVKLLEQIRKEQAEQLKQAKEQEFTLTKQKKTWEKYLEDVLEFSYEDTVALTDPKEAVREFSKQVNRLEKLKKYETELLGSLADVKEYDSQIADLKKAMVAKEETYKLDEASKIVEASKKQAIKDAETLRNLLEENTKDLQKYEDVYIRALTQSIMSLEQIPADRAQNLGVAEEMFSLLETFRNIRSELTGDTDVYQLDKYARILNAINDRETGIDEAIKRQDESGGVLERNEQRALEDAKHFSRRFVEDLNKGDLIILSDAISKQRQMIKYIETEYNFRITTQKSLNEKFTDQNQEFLATYYDLIETMKSMNKQIETLKEENKKTNDYSNPQSQATNNKFGGFQYFAGGGFATKGSDTIPAMLSPGEFVMNQRSTERFYSQLIRMNSPQPMAHGGQVTNLNGDFNISVHSSGSSKVDAVNIGRELRNEIRRGRVRI